MSNQQGDNPPSAAPAGAYGPGHTLLGEPAFVEPAPAAFPPPAPHAGAMVPATIVDASAYVPPPQYPASPYAGGTAPAAGYGMPAGPIPPTAAYNPPGPSPYGAPPPQAFPAAPPRRPAASSGPPMLIIGLAAFAVIGGLTTFLALRGRSSNEDSDKPIPTIDVPPVATIPSDPGPGAATGGDPTEPPPVEPPAVTTPPPAPKPTVAAPKPTVTTPTPVPTPTVTTRPTSTTPPPPPASTTKPPSKTGGPVVIPRRPIPRTR
jgi:hypothetical protein